MPDIREVAAQDEDGRNDVWTWEFLVQYAIASLNDKPPDNSDVIDSD
jgi:hypothetical protein